MKLVGYRIGLGLLVSVLALPAAVVAQTSSGTSGEEVSTQDEFDEEIVVTARRREENLQEVPVSVTAMTETDIETRSLDTLNDLDTFTPNLSFNITGGFGDEASESSVYMRGVGQLQAQRFTSDTGVGIYVDGVFVARAQGAVFDLLDLDRVEVLRGPQGTLFGRNAIGGAISLVTRRPSSEFQARLGLTGGEYNRSDVKLSVGGSLADNLSARLTGISANRDGFSESRWTGQEFNDTDYDAARLALDWQPSPSVSLQISSDYTRRREAGANMLLLGIDTSIDIVDFFNRVQSAGGKPTYSEEWITDSIFHSYAGFESFIDGDIYGTSISTAWTGSRVSLQSITAFRGFDIESFGDGDGSPALFAERERTQKQDQFSQEFQLSGLAADGRLNWQTGVLYFEERPREIGRGILFRDLVDTLESLPGAIIAPPGVPNFLCDPGPPPPGLPCFGGAGNPLNQAFSPALGFVIIDLETLSTAVFGEVSYQLSDRAELTVGLRYSRDDKELTRFGVESPLGDPIPTEPRSDEDAWSAWTPRVSFAYEVRQDMLFYLSASRGFKSGGFDTTVLENREGFTPYRPELMWTYEAGLKSQFFNRRLKLNQAIFYSDYEDIQFIVAELQDAIPVAVIRNAGTAEISGYELELEAELATGLNLNVGVGYTDAELVEIDPGSGIEPTASFPKTPEWNYNLGLQYAFAAAGGSMIARADYGWTGDFYHDFANSEPSFQEGYGLLNARLLYAPESDRWDVAVFGTNLTDEEFFESSLFLGAVGTTLAVGGRPREWGVTVQFRW